MTKKQKRQLYVGVLALAAAFLFLMFLIPALPVQEVALDATPTVWQNTHAWFVKAKDLFLNNAIVIGFIGAILYVILRITKK